MSLLPFYFDDFRPFQSSTFVNDYSSITVDREYSARPFRLSQHIKVSIKKPLHETLWKKYTSQPVLILSLNFGEDKFQINLDVQHFAPEEITVKVTGKNTITVEGKHEEKEDKQAVISKNFVRKYVLPEGHDIEKIQTMLSSDGILTIVAPRIHMEDRSIPIHQTGYPFPIEYKPTVTEK